MPRSAAFARLKRDLLRLVDAIPPGRLAAVSALAAAIDVPPRHVAYLLATLDADEQARHPWHRVVGPDGRWTHRHPGGAARLAAEGLRLKDGRVDDAAARLADPAAAAVALEAPRRPAAYTRPPGDRALAEARGIGPSTLALLERLGITTLAQLREADLFALYGRARALAPGTRLNLLYALIGAVEDRDWREVARAERTGVLLQLEQRGLL